MIKRPPYDLIPENIVSEYVLQEVAEIYGTPLYLYDKKIMMRQWERLRSFLPDYFSIYYSVKANPNPEIINIFRQLGASFETVSMGEIRAVQQMQGDQDDIIMIGPGKKDSDLKYAIDNQIYLVIESRNELYRIQKICEEKRRNIKAALRINPGNGTGMITMGGHTQFGMEEALAEDIIRTASQHPNVEINGLQFYLGTGILDESNFLNNVIMIFASAGKILKNTGVKLEFLDIGGGIGIPYHEKEYEFNLDGIRNRFQVVSDGFRKEYDYCGVLAFEAGRFLTGPSGIFLSRVVDSKVNFGKRYIVIDGGLNVFALDSRYMGFRHMPMKIIGTEKKEEAVTICGPLCTSSDRLAVDVQVPVPDIGELVAFFQAGAYAFTSSPGLFLSHGYPKEVLYDHNTHVEIKNYFL